MIRRKLSPRRRRSLLRSRRSRLYRLSSTSSSSSKSSHSSKRVTTRTMTSSSSITTIKNSQAATNLNLLLTIITPSSKESGANHPSSLMHSNKATAMLKVRVKTDIVATKIMEVMSGAPARSRS